MKTEKKRKGDFSILVYHKVDIEQEYFFLHKMLRNVHIILIQ